MKIIDEPQFGPMFRFNDANVYWSLYVLSGGRCMGRKRLASEVGVGEGSMRRIIDTLKEWDFILIKQTGEIHADWSDAVLKDVRLDVPAYRHVTFEPYDMHWIEKVE